MGKTPTILELFKRKKGENEISGPATNDPSTTPPNNAPSSETRPSKIPRVEELGCINENPNYLERDPGIRKQISEYPTNEKRNAIRRAYIAEGPYQPLLSVYKKSGQVSHLRSFQPTWYGNYCSWLEYSPAKDAAFCFICFLFSKLDGRPSHKAFIVNGFRNWKKVNGKYCAFKMHVGSEPDSPHRNAEKDLEDFLNQSGHLPQMLSRQSSQQVADNRRRLEASIDALRWLALQGLAMRGRDESEDSPNRGNFLEVVKLLASYNPDVERVVLGNAPKNASYISSDIQKEILHILSEKIKGAIREEIGDGKFCIIIDEAGDISKRQQMAIVLRFVNNLGRVKERFFTIIHVPNTLSVTLKNEIFSVLSHYCFDVKNIRGQGYDGASNMRGKWNGLQALVSDECSFAYYVHCFAHRLQLALVAAAKDVIPIYQFFNKLTFIVNVVLASYKRVDELRNAYTDEVNNLIENEELETGTGLNQASNLQRPGDTRWSSYLRSITSLIKMFSATCVVMYKLIDEGATLTERGDASIALDSMTTFDFVFILHLMKKILEITDSLSQALQRKCVDILNSLHLVESSKILLQKFRDDGWDALLLEVTSFCEVRNIDIPDMSSIYIERGGRARRQHDQFTTEHHYRVDIFYVGIDVQLQELNNRFSNKSVELLTLSCALEPRDGGKFFNISDICSLVNKFYPQDFTDVEKEALRMELCHYEVELFRHPTLKSLMTISDLSHWLVDTGKVNIYPYIFRLLKILLTLPVSTASAERAFSAMNTIKTTLRNKMEDDFFESCMLINIEKDVARNFTTKSLVDAFRDFKERRALL